MCNNMPVYFYVPIYGQCMILFSNLIPLEYLHDEGGVGGEGELLGRLLQQLKLSQFHVLQLPVTLPALQLLLERELKGILGDRPPKSGSAPF